MTNDQCKAVAEKVWGWEPKVITIHDTWWIKDNTRIFTSWEGSHDIEDEVKSWIGFGRTVEAMAKADMLIEIDSCLVLFKDSSQHICRGESTLLKVELAYAQKLIEATHRAALEAMEGR